MTVITTERLASAQNVMTKLVEQARLLFEDIAETAQDRERLAGELEQSRSHVDRLTVEARELNSRVTQSEHANNRLVDELNQLDTRLADTDSKLADATARLESISHTARLDGPSNVSDAPTPAATAGLAALNRMTTVNHRPSL